MIIIYMIVMFFFYIDACLFKKKLVLIELSFL